MKYLVFACVLLAMASSLWTSSASASSGLPYGTVGLTHGSPGASVRPGSSAPNSIAYTVTTNHGAQGLPGYHLYSSQATPTTRRKFRSNRRPSYNNNNYYYYDPINSYVPAAAAQHYYTESYYPQSYYNPYDNYPYYYY